MYDELVERLRAESYTLEELSIVLPRAADAIEELEKVLESVNDSHNEGYDVGYWAGRRDYEQGGCPFYIENKHDRGGDSLCRLFHSEVKYLAIGTRQVGEWIDDNCSVCGQYVHHGDARNYCPRCGAYMLEGNNEVDHDRQAGQPDIGNAGVRS